MKMPIKYKHLYAWDRMMGSFQVWSEMMQEKAERLNAPIDTIYFTGPDSETPVRAAELKEGHGFFSIYNSIFK